MSIQLISYDLIKPNKDYTQLINFLKTYTSWARPLESVWLIKNDLTAEQTRNQIQQHVDKDDKLIVVTVTGDSAAWINLPKDVSDWIRSNL